MKRARVNLALFSTILVFLWLLPDGLVAQDINRAALIIRHSDQSVQTSCIEFAEPEINGLELLQNSDFNLQLEVQGLGAAVCSIGQTGCPADDCWCKCRGGGDCTYWSYWHQPNGLWQYSQGGASTYTVRDGDIQGWSWGPGAVNAALPPPAISFDEVCTSSLVEDATDTPTPTPTSKPILFVPEDTPTGVATLSQPSQTETNTPVPVSTIPATATAAAIATAVSTKTPMPLNTATAVHIATEPVVNVPAQPEPMAEAAAAISEPLIIDDQNPNPTATLEPKPSATSEEAQQPSPEAVAAVSMVGASQSVRPGEPDTKKRIEVPVESQPKLTVVGAEVLAPSLRTIPVASENQIAGIEDGESPSSSFSYAVFGLILLGLIGMLLFSSAKRREREYASGDKGK